MTGISKAAAQASNNGLDKLKQSEILLAQLDPRPGDVWGNFEMAKNTILKANELGVKIVIFPELFLMGNPQGDLLSRHSYLIKRNIQALNKLAGFASDVIVVIGFMNTEQASSVAVLHKGKIVSKFRRGAEYGERILNLEGLRFGVLIGDENYSVFKDARRLDFLVNCACDMTREGSLVVIENRLVSASKALKTPIFYVNQVGAIDSFSFIGASSLYSRDGKLIARAKSFEEELFLCNNIINPIPEGLEYVYKLIVHSTRAYFKKCGFKCAVLGLSGGLDSAVCAALLVDALGSENVFGVFMPSEITTSESKKDAEDLAKQLGIGFFERPIKDIVSVTDAALNEVFSKMENLCGGRCKSSLTFDNIQARARATILWCITNEFEATMTIATSDKSELYMGYATINGDMSGGFAPICDVLKTRLFKLADWLNENKGNRIPHNILKKRPGAELAIDNKTQKPLLAEDALMPYEFLDEAIIRLEEKQQDFETMLSSQFAYELKNGISFEQKREWLEKFFKRVEAAPFKWSLMPPGPILCAHSINKSEYSYPIVSKII